MERIEIRQKEKANEETTEGRMKKIKTRRKKRAERVYFRRARGPSRNNAL